MTNMTEGDALISGLWVWAALLSFFGWQVIRLYRKIRRRWKAHAGLSVDDPSRTSPHA